MTAPTASRRTATRRAWPPRDRAGQQPPVGTTYYERVRRPFPLI